jgi:hypothetical protein
MSRASRFVSALLVAGSLLCPRAAAAQQSNFSPTVDANPQAGSGWSLTPALTYSGAWDDNVLVRGNGDVAAEDFLSVINPRATLDFNGRRGTVSASYDGAFLLYRELSSLNSYDQRGSFYARRLLTPHVALFVRSYAAQVPTTELVAFVGLPFVRNGSRIVDTQGGVTASLTKLTTLTVTYDLQLVDFDHSAIGSEALRGGHSQGATAALRHNLDARLTLTADYEVTHANTHPFVGDVGVDQAFDIQNVWAGAEYKLSERTRVFGGGGISRLGVTQLSEARTGPAVRAGVVQNFSGVSVDAEYSRSFVPSYGFGGTTQNEELTARVRLPLASRLYTSGGVSWRRNEPLVLTNIDLPLRSFWLEAMLGYAATPSVHIEGFYGGTRQTIDRPGGQTDRNRFGLQVTTTKPMRIR